MVVSSSFPAGSQVLVLWDFEVHISIGTYSSKRHLQSVAASLAAARTTVTSVWTMPVAAASASSSHAIHPGCNIGYSWTFLTSIYWPPWKIQSSSAVAVQKAETPSA